MNKNNVSSTFFVTLLMALIPEMDNAVILRDRLKTNHLRLGRSELRFISSVALMLVLSLTVLMSVMPFEAQAVGGAYDLKWYAADPKVNHAPYFPTYPKIPASSAPLPIHTVGR